MIKKVTFKNSKNLTLVGSLYSASPNAIVIMAHGSGENKTGRGLFVKIANALQQENYSVLAYDAAGHGESDDAIISMQTATEDLISAIEFAKSQGYTRIALFGHSLGTIACLKAFNPSIETMVLSGALAGPVQWQWESMCTPEQLEEIRQKGYVSEHVNDGLREAVKIDAGLLQEIREIDQEKILKAVACPVLIIHGDSAGQEADLLEYSKKALPLLPAGSELQIIPGASHLFLEHAPQVIELTKKWYKKYFSIK
jgi:pimeloyl-ACP methyl ester carboxylesterase